MPTAIPKNAMRCRDCNSTMPRSMFGTTELSNYKERGFLSPQCKACAHYSMPPAITVYTVPESVTKEDVESIFDKAGVRRNLVGMDDRRADNAKLPVKKGGNHRYERPALVLYFDRDLGGLNADVRAAVKLLPWPTRIPADAEKSKMCEAYARGATCYWGNRCPFAHGEHELRKVAATPGEEESDERAAEGGGAG